MKASTRMMHLCISAIFVAACSSQTNKKAASSNPSCEIPSGWLETTGSSSNSMRSIMSVAHGSDQASVKVVEMLGTAGKHTDKANRISFITRSIASQYQEQGMLIESNMSRFAGKDVGEIISERDHPGYVTGRERSRSLFYDPGPDKNLILISIAYDPEVLSMIQKDLENMEGSWAWD